VPADPTLNPVAWELRHIPGAGRYQATFPRNPGPPPTAGPQPSFEPPQIVRLEIGRQTAILKASSRIGGGQQVFVSPASLPSVPDAIAVVICEAPFSSYVWSVLKTDASAQKTILALLCSALSALITLSLAIGKVVVVVNVGDAGVVLSLIAAGVLGIAGTALGVVIALSKLL
jgi:hypothetical protein